MGPRPDRAGRLLDNLVKLPAAGQLGMLRRVANYVKDRLRGRVNRRFSYVRKIQHVHLLLNIPGYRCQNVAVMSTHDVKGWRWDPAAGAETGLVLVHGPGTIRMAAPSVLLEPVTSQHANETQRHRLTPLPAELLCDTETGNSGTAGPTIGPQHREDSYARTV